MKRNIGIGLLLSLIAVSAQASIVQYADQATFNAAVSDTTTIDFSNESFSGFAGLGTTASFGPAGNQVQFSNEQNLYGAEAGSAYNNTDDLIVGHGDHPTYITFSSGGVAAVGLTLYAAQDYGNTRLSITENGTATVFDLTPPYKIATSGQFYGFIATDDISEIALYKLKDPDNTYAVLAPTEITYGVPEPTSLCLLAGGALFLRLRRK